MAKYRIARLPGDGSGVDVLEAAEDPDAVHESKIFLQNAINLRLRTVVCPTIHAEQGDDLEVTAAGSSTKRPQRLADIVTNLRKI